MRCSVKDILKNGDFAEISGSMEYETLENNGDMITFTTPIEFSGEMKRHNEDILVTGEIEFEYKVNCHRCLEEISTSLKIPVCEVFSTKQTEEGYVLKGEILDLQEMIIDNIHLNLPIKFLCSDNCKGFCTTCGANLNNNKCTC